MATIAQLQHRIVSGRYDADAYLALCTALVGRGQLEYAAQFFDRWKAADPDNPTIGYHRSVLLDPVPPERAPVGFLVHEFDSFAESFDHVLDGLRYRVPQLMQAALLASVARSGLEVLDLGCGTGLCGLSAKAHAASLTGVDVSPGMLALAMRRGIYDRIVEADFFDFLSACEDRYDLVIAGDSLIYVGELGELLARIRHVCRTQARFILTLELGPETVPYVATARGRYAHAAAYVRQELCSHGFSLAAFEQAVLRIEERQPVDGLVVTAVADDR